MWFGGDVGGRVLAGTGAVCAAALCVLIWSGAEAEPAAPEPVEAVRLPDGAGYVPHDPEGFDALATGLAALPPEELAQMAGFAAALAADLDEFSSDELAGRVGDLITVVDLAYADARQARPGRPGYDAERLRGIADRIGYDTEGLPGG
ncbi:hypothetical protein [Jannaschia formosa]|uniref:hypothetical protein n=1 Tax=Jannaschia formosa TaxID=2259592 RepID=UPI000E1B7E57|nr:hypothetical protein [Jannaschia formosa]TFL19866.1 hypothetical protein DR046_00520 [Jannaschia formosa]